MSKAKMIIKKLFFISILILLGIALSYFTKKQEQIISSIKLETKSNALNPKILKAVSAGYSNILADIYWFELIQAADEKRWKDIGKSWLFYKINTVINLDTKFRAAYDFGILYLVIFKEDYEGSKVIIDKAIEAYPRQWQYPFVLGYSYIFEKPDMTEAARYFALAAEKPTAPKHIKLLASRLAARTGNFDFAISSLLTLKAGISSDTERAEIDKKIKAIIIERQYTEFEEQITKFKDTFKKNPKDISDLTNFALKTENKKLITSDPEGGLFFVTPNGKIANTKSKRIKVAGYDKN